jgi:hypothetical protein
MTGLLISVCVIAASVALGLACHNLGGEWWALAAPGGVLIGRIAQHIEQQCEV